MPPALIFDLDGTLIDSAPAICAVSNAVLMAQGFPGLDHDQIRSFVGRGVPNLVRCLLQAVDEDPDGPQFQRLHDDLITRYETEVEGNTLYPGVLQALTDLAARGHAMAIATNKPLRPAQAVLRHLGLERFFPVVLGGDSLPTRKPDPAMAHEAHRLLDRPRALFIGDSEVDAETAANAGMPFLLYTEGYRKSPVEDLPHTAAFATFRALPDLVARLS
jgi:phosphoglycolate phosphatase